jgi:hypothetical protein
VMEDAIKAERKKREQRAPGKRSSNISKWCA